MSGPDPRLRPDSRLTAAEIEALEASGAWLRRSLRSFLADSAKRHPDRIAAVSYSAVRPGPPTRLTYAELDALASRLAGGLRELGVRQDDVVGVMLPNRSEFAALIFAIGEAGATYTGIPAAYGAREVRQILGQSGARAAVVDDSGGLAIVRGLREELPALEHVVVLGDAELEPGEVPYDSLRGTPPAERPDSHMFVCHIGYTSGTTGAPKGVMNTAQTLETILRKWVEHVGGLETLGDPPVNFVASPVGHHTGFCWGVLLSAYLSGTAVYLDRWQPPLAARIMRDEGVTAMFCAPTFVQDLLDVGPLEGGALRLLLVAGAPIPRSLPEIAGRALGGAICPAWGMTEYGIAISWAPRLGPEGQRTDGVAVPGAEVRVVDGNLEMRGDGLFIGYHRQPEANAEAFADGWFATGDTATIDDDGLVRLVGRTKDIVIRGGENVPVVEVESLLFDHPKIRDLAIIGVPDERLGQRACAVVVPAPGDEPTLEELCDHLLERGLSKRFLPERLELVQALPKTASGKIRKVELREGFA